MDSALAVVSFGGGGLIEVRAEPPALVLLEVRGVHGTTRTATHEWHPGRGGVRLIRYLRGEAVEQRPVLPGQIQRIASGRTGESLRLQGVSDDGSPRVLDFRLVPANTAVTATGANPALGAQSTATGAPAPTAGGSAFGGGPEGGLGGPPAGLSGSVDLPPRVVRTPTGPLPVHLGAGPDLNALVGAIDARIGPRLESIGDRLVALETATTPAPMVHRDDRLASDVGAALLPVLHERFDALARRLEREPSPAPIDLEPLLARLAHIDAEVSAQTLAQTLAQTSAQAAGLAASARPPTAPPVDLSPVLARLEALEMRIATAPQVEPPDLTPVLARIAALDARLQAGLDALPGAAEAAQQAAAASAPVLARLAALEQSLADTLEALRPDLRPVAEALGRLQSAVADNAPDLDPLSARLDALEARLQSPDLATRLAAAVPAPPSAEALAAALTASLAPHLEANLEANLKAAFEATLEAKLEAKLEARLGALGGGLDARFAPLAAALDRADRDRSLAQERIHAVTDRLVGLEARLDDDGGLGGRLAAIHERITRLAAQFNEDLQGAARFEDLAEHLIRIERMLLAAPSLDGRLTAIQAQIGRIEEGAGSITPELIELIAAKLETLDPRAAMADLDARVFGFSRRLDDLNQQLQAGLGADSPLGTALAGTLAQLKNGLEALAPAFGAQLAPLAAESAARAQAEAAVAAAVESLGIQVAALNERVDPGPALAEVQAQLVALDDTEHAAAAFEHLRHGLDRLVARPEAADHTEALLRQEELLERLERLVRTDGKQVDKAIAAAMAAVRSFSDDGQMDLIEERLARIEKKSGGVDPRVVEQLEAAARRLRDAGPGADLTPVLERLDELGRRVTQMPPGQPPVADLGDLEGRLEHLLGQVAPLVQWAQSARSAGPAPELLILGEQVEALGAQVEALAGRLAEVPVARTDATGGPEAGGPEAGGPEAGGTLPDLAALTHAALEAMAPALAALDHKLDGLAYHLDHGTSAPLGLMALKLDALTARVEDARHDPAPAVEGAGGAAPDLGPLLAVVERLGTRVDALAQRVDLLAGRLASPTPHGGGHPGALTGPEVDVPLDPAEESIDISSFPPSEEEAELDAPGPPADASITPRRPPGTPEPPRRSTDGAMLDGLDLLIDVIQTRHFDPQSVRGLLAPPRLESLRQRLQGLREAFTGRLPVSTARLVDQLAERIDDARTDQVVAAQKALAAGDYADAIVKVARALQSEGQAPLNTENVERMVLGIAKAVWDADPSVMAGEGAPRAALEAVLAELELALVVPVVSTSWHPKDQRVQARRPGRPGEPLNLVLEVHAPGFRRGEVVVEKAAVTISD